MESKLKLSVTQNKHFSYATVEIEHIQIQRVHRNDTNVSGAENVVWITLRYWRPLFIVVQRVHFSRRFITLLFAAVISNAFLD